MFNILGSGLEDLVLKIITEDSDLYREALDLRYTLFFKGFDLPKSVTADDLEPVSVHVALVENNNLLAYGRLSPLDSGTYRISQIVVYPEHRRKGFASRIVSELMLLGGELGAQKVVLNSQVPVLPLYRKLGFREYGEQYKVKLTGVLHQKMAYDF